MREFGGMKFREIAEVMGVSENTIKSRMRYALQTLRGYLEEYRDFSFDTAEERDRAARLSAPPQIEIGRPAFRFGSKKQIDDDISVVHTPD